MGLRRLPGSLCVVGVLLAIVVASCSTATAPHWTYGPAASPGAVPPLSLSPLPGASSSATPAPSESPAPSPSPSPSASATPAPSEASAPSSSPSPSPVPSPSATRPPGPPDPGEPGFVPGTTRAPRVISIAVTDVLLFDPTIVAVQQGETITFRITNAGKAEHEFKVGPMKDVFDDLPTTPEVAGITPGTTKTLTYTFSGTGPYAYACHAPGHFENGMFGFVNVVPTSPWLGTQNHPRMIVLRMDDHLEFVPSEVSVTPGETILFVLANVGSSLTHEFQVGPADRVALDQADGQIVIEVDKIEPLHIDFLTYTFGGVGPYAFACHEPGHYEAGMKGIVDVTP
jgi:uncharacterized cupredoxin-like copper-binding protein